jgi:large subunit ribosomal protein L14
MIQMQSYMNVADNSGAKRVQTIKVLGGSHRRYAGIGDIVVVTVKDALPNAPIKKGDVRRAVIVRTHKEYRRTRRNLHPLRRQCLRHHRCGTGNPVGKRIFGPVARELRDYDYMKIVSLAPEVL